MITFAGDLHGNFIPLERLHYQFRWKEPVVQVGDFNLWQTSINLNWPRGLGFDTYVLPGNHCNNRWLRTLPSDRLTEVGDRLYYVPPGQVLQLEGLRLGCLGGGSSVDRASRTEDLDWWPEEEVTEEQMLRLWDEEFDVLVTHSPPRSITQLLLPKLDLESLELPPDWRDWSALRVETLWQHKQRMPMVCGHLHLSAQMGTCRVLDICELLEWRT